MCCFQISVVLLLDEPTWDLDPLNTYLVISILSNHARKYGRAVVLTMEKPRSDVFPFLDRVAYLCLGDVVYTGGTRLMLDYFRSIGFPCPELENPLMYYCKYEKITHLYPIWKSQIRAPQTTVSRLAVSPRATCNTMVILKAPAFKNSNAWMMMEKDAVHSAV